MPKPTHPTQGGKAVEYGNTLERFVLHTLNDRKYTFVHNRRFIAACCLEQPLYTRQITVGESIYHTPLRADFMLYHPVKHLGKLIIECKWQQIAGSVDEKYPYTVQNIREKYPCPTIILLDGNGYKPGAKEWLCSQVDDKLLAVFSMSEFQKWVNKGGL
jgi:hypothetical protein